MNKTTGFRPGRANMSECVFHLPCAALRPPGVAKSELHAAHAVTAAYVFRGAGWLHGDARGWAGGRGQGARRDADHVTKWALNKAQAPGGNKLAGGGIGVRRPSARRAFQRPSGATSSCAGRWHGSSGRAAGAPGVRGRVGEGAPFGGVCAMSYRRSPICGFCSAAPS